MSWGKQIFQNIIYIFLTVLFVFFSVFKSVIKYSCNKENIFCSFNQKILPPSLEQLCKEAMLKISV